MSKIRPEVAKRRIEFFEKRFGKAHLYLAYHAAFPLSLTPDLLYRLWANFQRDIRGEVLSIPWIAVADLLLSSLCDEVGHELYEMDVVVRNQLLSQLKEDEKFGQQRIYQLSNFLLNYIRQQLQSDDPDIRDFAQAQRWIALAYMPTQASEAVRELALALSRTYHNDRSDLLRLASLVETLAEPLGGLEEYQPLLIYARGMKKFAGGDLEAATNELGKALGEGNKIRVAEISLPIPKQIKATNLSRRQIIQYLGWGGFGLGLAVIGGRQFQTQVQNSSQQSSQPISSPQPTPERVSLQTVQFEVVAVNSRGDITSRRPDQAKLFTEDLGNGVTLEMVSIPAGSFQMGSPPGEKGGKENEGPQRMVKVPTFFMGRFAVTQEQYQQVMGNSNSYSFKGAKRPVENVSWNDAVKFCQKLSQKTGRTYRLPSEAEWECACRAGTTTPFHFGETITDKLANYRASNTYANEPKGQYREQTTEVGSFPPNAFGLYDMHGNVWEWCEDTWHDNYIGAPTDGSPWINDNDKRYVLRGGSWYDNPDICRSANRHWGSPDHVNNRHGFRVVCGAAAWTS